MQQLLGFHGIVRQPADGLLRQEVGAAARAAGMTLVSADEPWASLVYGGEGRRSIDFTFKASAADAQVVMGPLERETFAQWGSTVMSDLLTRVCRGADVVLGRTYRGGAGGHGVVDQQELTGNLEFIDWYQYLSPTLVHRWGAARLAGGPFHKTELLDNGAMTLLLGADPFEAMMSRKAAAEYLGITLRPLVGRDFQGSPIDLHWK